mgnify:CR=1 FL=1
MRRRRGAHESSESTILSVATAVTRGRKTACAHCGKLGATLGCSTHRCKRSYHYGCVPAAGAVLLSDKRLYCGEHRQTKQASKGAVWDPQTRVPRPLLADEKVARRSLWISCSGASSPMTRDSLATLLVRR